MVDARVKERLTGAVILVALLVLLVPELLSGPGTAAGTTNPSSADGQQMRSYTIDLADDTVARRSAAASPLAPAPTPVVPLPSAASPANAAPADVPVVADAHPEAAPTPSVPPPRAATPPPESRATSTRASGGGWAVQVGSFASRENAERLARELKGKGFESHVSESSGSSGKRLWRVRVGPEPDRASAAALGARLRSTGQSGSVVPMP